MALEEFTLNTDYGLTRATRFRVLVKDLGNGREQRISKSTCALHEYNMKFTSRLTSEMQAALYDFYVARGGSLEAFILPDPFDGEHRTVRFKDGDLSEEFFSRLVENSSIAVVEVVS